MTLLSRRDVGKILAAGFTGAECLGSAARQFISWEDSRPKWKATASGKVFQRELRDRPLEKDD
jgi:hypothetical protein